MWLIDFMCQVDFLCLNKIFKFPPPLDPFCQMNSSFELSWAYPSYPIQKSTFQLDSRLLGRDYINFRKPFAQCFISMQGLKYAEKVWIYTDQRKFLKRNFFEGFTILLKENKRFKLHLKESLLIKLDNPELDRNIYSYPLEIFDWLLS